MSPIIISIQYDEIKWQEAFSVSFFERITDCIVSIVSASFQHNKEYEVSVVLTNDAVIRSLNQEYRHKDKATNVLSFPQKMSCNVPIPYLLGDIVLAYETIVAEAIQENKTLCAHVTHLFIHGFLHLLGYDHNTDHATHLMQTLEVQILYQLGIQTPYPDTINES